MNTMLLCEEKPYYFRPWTFTKINFKRKISTWTRIRTRTSRSLIRRFSVELSWVSFQFTFNLSSWNVHNFFKTMIDDGTCHLITIKQTNFAVKKYDAIGENKLYNFRLCTFTKFNFKREIRTWTGLRSRNSRPQVWRSANESSWFLYQFTFKLPSWSVCNLYMTIWSMTVPTIYW